MFISVIIIRPMTYILLDTLFIMKGLVPYWLLASSIALIGELLLFRLNNRINISGSIVQWNRNFNKFDVYYSLFIIALGFFSFGIFVYDLIQNYEYRKRENSTGSSPYN